MYEVPPDPPSRPPLQRSSEVAILLVLGMLILATLAGNLIALIAGMPLAAFWYKQRNELDQAMRSSAPASRSPRTIFDPTTWLIILALLGLLAVPLYWG
jgi:hypothetical protein